MVHASDKIKIHAIKFISRLDLYIVYFRIIIIYYQVIIVCFTRFIAYFITQIDRFI